MEGTAGSKPRPEFNTAEIGALAHLYRGEMYRSKIWRTRLDATTNWAVVTTGIAMSVTFSSAEASPLPIVLVSLLVLVFLIFESRRYRFFDIFRVRVRVMETQFYGALLRGERLRGDNRWPEILADDYTGLRYHISYWEALGRRLRRNYSWIFAIQLATYLGKLFIHPTPMKNKRRSGSVRRSGRCRANSPSRWASCSTAPGSSSPWSHCAGSGRSAGPIGRSTTPCHNSRPPKRTPLNRSEGYRPNRPRGRSTRNAASKPKTAMSR